MKSEDEAIKEVIDLLTDLIKKLDENQEVTESNWSQLMGAIKDLKAMKKENNIEYQEKEDSEADQLLNDFNQNSNDIIKLISSIEQTISNQMVPDEQTVFEFENLIVQLREKYSFILDKAKECSFNGETPETKQPISVYIDIIKNSRVYKQKQQIEATKTILNRFISVSSDIDQYKEALKPHQVETEKQLALIEENKKIEDVNSSIVGPELFLRVLDCKDLDSSEGNLLLQQAGEYFKNTTISMGLIREKYYISDAINCNRLEKETPDSKVEETSYEVINKVKTGKLNATSFIKEILSDLKTNKYIILNICFLGDIGLLTEEQLYKFFQIVGEIKDIDSQKDRIKKALVALTSKGYVAQYKHSATGKMIYGLSASTMDVLKKESVKEKMKNTLNGSIKNIHNINEKTIGDPLASAIVENNTLLVQTFEAIKNIESEDEFKASKSSIQWSDNHYLISICYENEKYQCDILKEDTKENERVYPNCIIVNPQRKITDETLEKYEKVFVINDDSISLNDAKC